MIQVDFEEDEEVKGEIVGFIIEGGFIVCFVQFFIQLLLDYVDFFGFCEDNCLFVVY